MSRHKKKTKNKKHRSFRADREIRIAGDVKIFAVIAVVFLVLIGVSMARLEPARQISVAVPEFNEFQNPPGTPGSAIIGPVEPNPSGQNQGSQTETPVPVPKPPLPLPPQGNASGEGPLIPVLMYHHVGDTPIRADAIRRDLTVSTKDFVDQVNLVQKLGYNAITATQIDAYLHGTGSLPQKPILFTFDDGYDDVFQNAAPILAAHHMVGSFAIITGFVGQTGYAGWPTLQAALSSGMELVCHSEHHMDFTNRSYTEEMKTAEVADCKKDLFDQLGVATRIFIYPYGHYNSDIEQILRQNNFDISFTTRFGMVRKGEAVLELPRVRVHGVESLSTFQHSLGG